MSGLIGKKLGMSSIFDALGRSIPVTVIEVAPCTITQIKTEETDGYNAVQIASYDRKAKRTTKALEGHFSKAGIKPKKQIKEFRDYLPEGLELGDEISIDDVFKVGDRVDVLGISKGKGFTGAIKRHNFSGADSSHGLKSQQRAGGSIGQASDPSRVFKGKKMSGRSGNARTKIKNLSVAKILSESNMILVTGSVPGARGGYLEIYNKS